MSEKQQYLLNGFRDTPLGPLPEDWQVVRLGEVITQRKEFITVVADTTYKRPRVQVRGEGIVLRDTVEGSALKIKRQQVCRAGEFLVAEIDAKVGGCGIVPPDLDGAIVSSHYFLFEMDAKRLDSGFLGYFVRLSMFMSQVEARGSTNYASIRPTHVLSYLIPLPPLPEQRAIAHVLTSIQRAIEATERVIAAARELKKSLMRHLFTYGPVPVGAQHAVPLRETEIGPLPAHWQVVRLGEVGTSQYGLSLRGQRNGKYPIIRMNNLVDGKVSDFALQYVELNKDNFEKFRLNKGDILFNRTNSYELVGKTAIFDLERECVFASYLIRLTVNHSRLTPYFLNYYLNYPKTQERLKMLATRAVSQSNINATRLRGFPIPLPPLAEQRRIAEILAVVDEKIQAEEKRQAALQSLFQSMLHHLMTGQVRVTQIAPEESHAL